ncbi:putative molybdenum carrier protein [Verrucomicrobium spinosum]|uniref:putative molybdenum carrier protein n=1 Tax=Verrucomicrobium spinosum TaxID=2736 RepID=UPI00210CD0B1|nr:putative molybdenum carrier protein [Verrucomicrobium spinosum]
MLDAKYQLKETEKDVTIERTEWNVRDADATVVFTFAEKATGGALKSVTFARKLKKPCLHLHRGILAGSEKLVAFMDKHRVRRLNIAGSHEEKEPGIYVWVTSTLDKAEDHDANGRALSLAALQDTVSQHGGFREALEP